MASCFGFARGFLRGGLGFLLLGKLSLNVDDLPAVGVGFPVVLHDAAQVARLLHGLNLVVGLHDAADFVAGDGKAGVGEGGHQRTFFLT